MNKYTVLRCVLYPTVFLSGIGTIIGGTQFQSNKSYEKDLNCKNLSSSDNVCCKTNFNNLNNFDYYHQKDKCNINSNIIDCVETCKNIYNQKQASLIGTAVSGAFFGSSLISLIGASCYFN